MPGWQRRLFGGDRYLNPPARWCDAGYGCRALSSPECYSCTVMPSTAPMRYLAQSQRSGGRSMDTVLHGWEITGHILGAEARLLGTTPVHRRSPPTHGSLRDTVLTAVAGGARKRFPRRTGELWTHSLFKARRRRIQPMRTDVVRREVRRHVSKLPRGDRGHTLDEGMTTYGTRSFEDGSGTDTIPLIRRGYGHGSRALGRRVVGTRTRGERLEDTWREVR